MTSLNLPLEATARISAATIAEHPLFVLRSFPSSYDASLVVLRLLAPCLPTRHVPQAHPVVAFHEALPLFFFYYLQHTSASFLVSLIVYILLLEKKKSETRTNVVVLPT